MRGTTGVGFFLGTVALGAQANDILKPDADYREIRHFQLSNGMSALAVHHARATEAGFAVAAQTGSLYDPKEVPGLAHFLEHMLFLGTNKYPNPESYDSFMSQNGGGNNAYTDEEKTVFFNKIADSALDEALDRFSEFFKNPLFNREYEEKEVNAIDAEHQKNIPNDDERSWFVIRSLAKGPMSNFSTGNLATLHETPKQNGIDVVGLLHDFHQKYYCGANMTAVTISPRSLDEQEMLIREKFEGISAGNTSWLGLTQCPGPEFSKVAPFDASNTGKYVHLQSFSGEPSLWISFGLPPTMTSYKQQPMSVLSYMLEYAGEGSLVQRLRLLGVADSVSVTMDRNSVSTLLGLKVDLTAKGEKHRGLVVQEVFSYINFLKDNGISHDVMSSLSQQSYIDFHTTQPGSSLMNEAARLAHNLLTYEPYHAMAGDSLLIDADPRIANELLQKMEPSSAIIAFSDPSFVSKANDFQTDPYYGVQFRVIDIPQNHAIAMAVLAAAPNAFRMPPHLLHLPTSADLQVMHNITGMKQPILLADGENAGASVWWQGHGAFALPRVTVKIQGSVMEGGTDFLLRAQQSLTLSAIADQLSEEAVDFQNCGITHSVQYTSTGFELFFQGYSENQVSNIMGFVAKKLSNPSTLEAERFERVKAQQLKLLNDPATSMAFEHAVDAANILTRNDAFTRSDMINAIQEVQFDDAILSVSQLKKASMDAFVMGNIKGDDALTLVQQFLVNADFNTIPREDSKKSLAMEQKQTIEATLANPIKGDSNHATLVQLQLGIPTIDERVNLAVLSQFINRHLYDNLRTEAQLGYIVGAREARAGSTSELQCFVEGSKTHPDEVVKLIDAELNKAKEYLTNMSEAELQHWKNAMSAKLSRQEVNSAEEFAQSGEEIFSHANCFTKRSLEQQYLQKNFSKDHLVRTFTKLLEPSKRLVVKLIANLEPEKEVTLIGAPIQKATLNNENDQELHASRLLSLENKFVSKIQQENGYFPDVAICDAPSDFIMKFEMLEGF